MEEKTETNLWWTWLLSLNIFKLEVWRLYRISFMILKNQEGGETVTVNSCFLLKFNYGLSKTTSEMETWGKMSFNSCLGSGAGPWVSIPCLLQDTSHLYSDIPSAQTFNPNISLPFWFLLGLQQIVSLLPWFAMQSLVKGYNKSTTQLQIKDNMQQNWTS